MNDKHDRTRELEEIISKHEFTNQEVARLTGCAFNLVGMWRKEKPIIPEHRLRLLKLEINLRNGLKV